MNLPNKLTMLRILLIPVFMVVLYMGFAGSAYVALAIFIVASLTDLLDGKIARKYNLVTDFGKFADPLADKMTQGILFLCLAIRYPHIWLLLILWALKDGFMGIMGLILLRKKHTKLDGAKWYGKVCTAIIYLGVLLLLFFPAAFPPESYTAHLLILICAIALLLAGVLYTIELIKMWIHNETIKREKKRRKEKMKSEKMFIIA